MIELKHPNFIVFTMQLLIKEKMKNGIWILERKYKKECKEILKLIKWN